MIDLSGTWLGTYWQMGTQTRFEMTLIQSGNALTGNVLDDGYLGEAALDGQVVGRSIQFCKTYFDSRQSPVNYKGTLAEDGNSMQGTWDFYGVIGFEPWEARRNGENLSLSRILDQSKDLQTVAIRG
ncbi:MAG: hypothetical protein WCD18_24960 [Thermosynechococcaceae cyanobacterium]